jgi:hypothetical protein
LNLCGKKINHWYKNFLSNFTKDQKEKEIQQEKNFDTKDPSEKENIYIKEKVLDIDKALKNNRGKAKNKYKKYYKTIQKKIVQNKKIRVPILKVENFGERMCIYRKVL